MPRSHSRSRVRAFRTHLLIFSGLFGLHVVLFSSAMARDASQARAPVLPTAAPETGRVPVRVAQRKQLRRLTNDTAAAHAKGVAAAAPSAIAMRTQAPQAGASAIETARTAPNGIPIVLNIPSISLSSSIEEEGLLPDGKPAVPDATRVGWYKLGPRPGERGKAVLMGHLNSARGPGIFWNLNKVKTGDQITVVDDGGTTRHFRVRATKLYDVRTAPVEEIFGASDEHLLNIITCAGSWDTRLGHYDERFVVFAESTDTVL